jgi:hypothetical protein
MQDDSRTELIGALVTEKHRVDGEGRILRFLSGGFDASSGQPRPYHGRGEKAIQSQLSVGHYVITSNLWLFERKIIERRGAQNDVSSP